MKTNKFKNVTKKVIAATAVCCTLLSSASAFAAAENIIINDSYVTIPEEMGRIREMDERTFVPVRFVSEYLGCTVDYSPVVRTTEVNGEVIEYIDETIIMTNVENGVSYFMTVGDNKLFVLSDTNPRYITMDTNVFIGDDDRTYIPIRYLAEAMNYNVSWDEETQTVGLTAK